ncbi:hypothetical protein DNU06_14000 [Putridiphycobacter roseus]|uniref:SPOR domain-containing protein n=1 Tax=Putridiphycobacter roseus TaxID=2219161 RepID=A0A2W1MWJ4_9FLAO|nr:PorP/SprF family type IX secretion system membrane protein [Putridiphycobacter roseus]PZE16237.1 hypothetical protein DNU06_14000 [Putridiphycobacter roseus]
MKLNIFKLFLFTAINISSICIGQQSPLLQHNYLSPFVYNPAYAGMNDGAEMGIIRNQKWADFNGGIITNLLVAHTRLKTSNSAIGFNLGSDNLGLTNRINAHLSYAYRIKLSDKLTIQPGLSVGIIDQRIHMNEIIGDANDPVLQQSFASNKTILDANFGVFMQYEAFTLGIAMPQLLENKFSLSNTNLYSFELARQYVFNSSYHFKFKKHDNLFVKPDILAIYSPNVPLHYSATLLAGHQKWGWLGATYKSDYAVAASIGFSFIENLKISMAYDIPIGAMASISNSNNFEIALFYQIKQNKPAENNNFSEEKLENRLKTVVEQQAVKDAIQYAIIDSLTNQINIKKIEQKVLEDENVLIKETLTHFDSINRIHHTNEEIKSNNETTETASPRENEILKTKNKTKKNEDQTILKKGDKGAVDGKNIKVNQKPIYDGLNESIQTKSIKIKDDYFTEVMNSEASPNGYYIVNGTYSTLKEAERLLKTAIPLFPQSKILINSRNQKYYVVLYYSEDIKGVIDALIISNSINEPGFKNAWAMNYFYKN